MWRDIVEKAIIIAGPTGVGKTKISVALAKKLNGEIISADSMQIYRHMNIGTAKVTEEEKQAVPHYLIDVVEPDESYSVHDFQRAALDCIKDISVRGKVPIIVGGTGLYINSLLYDMDFQSEISDFSLREELRRVYEKQGEEVLIDVLRGLDAEKANSIDKKNIKRVIRAIEIAKYKEKNKDFSTDILPRKDMEFLLFILSAPRQELYHRINIRVDTMLEEGLVEEVRNLKTKYFLTREHQSMKGIGYRQILDYLEGSIQKEQAIEKIKQESRRYAKRQLTWFKRYQQGIWEENYNFEDILNLFYDKSTEFLMKP